MTDPGDDGFSSLDDPPDAAGAGSPQNAPVQVPSIDEAITLALFDACSLALLGRTSEALSCIDTAGVSYVHASGRPPPTVAFLLKARILLDDADPGLRHQAEEMMKKIASGDGPVAALAREEVQRHKTLAPRVSKTTLLRLVDLGKRLAGDLEPREVLRLVLHEAIELARCRRGFIALARGREIDFAVAENVEWGEIADPYRQISHKLIEEVLSSGRPVFFHPGTPADHPAAASLSELGIHFALCFPIADLGATVGALYLDRIDGFPAADEDLPRLLELLSGLAARAIQHAWVRDKRRRELRAARSALRRREGKNSRCRYGGLVGASEAMQETYRCLDRVIATSFPVLIEGETGTGKDVVARMIHELGPRQRRRFVVVNCAGVAENLLEDELFGHERGAFSGAQNIRPGVFELADRGTLFFDEIGEMSARMQAALLRSLETGEVRRLGGTVLHEYDVRILAASHRDLEREVSAGRFRQDLFFRLNVLRIRLSPLRERPEDIPLLVDELARRQGVSLDLSRQALMQLMGRSWPGNVRELENLLKRLVAGGLRRVEAADLSPEQGQPCGKTSAERGTLWEAEVSAIEDALRRSGGNRSEAARTLGISRKTLYAKLRRIGRSTLSGC